MDGDEKGEKLSTIISMLGVTETELEACKGKGIRVTVRQIMKMKFPEPPLGFKFADVDPDYVTAAQGKTELFVCISEK